MRHILLFILVIATVSAVPQEESILVWWDFEGSGEDITYNGNDLSVTSGDYVTGIKNLSFDTQGSGYASITGLESYYDGRHDLNVTFSLWIDPKDMSADIPIFYVESLSPPFGVNGSVESQVSLHYNATDNRLYVGEEKDNYRKTDVTLNPNSFNHILLTSYYEWDQNGRYKLYVNGENVREIPDLLEMNMTSPFSINYHPDIPRGDFVIDEFAVYEHYMSDAEAESLYNGTDRFFQGGVKPVEESFKTGVCPMEDTASAILFMGLLIFGMVILMVSLMSQSIMMSFLSSLLIIFMSFPLFGCSGSLGAIFAVIGITGIILTMRLPVGK